MPTEAMSIARQRRTASTPSCWTAKKRSRSPPAPTAPTCCWSRQGSDARVRSESSDADPGECMPFGILNEHPQVDLLRLRSRLMFQHYPRRLVGFVESFEQARHEVGGTRAADADHRGVTVVER